MSTKQHYQERHDFAVGHMLRLGRKKGNPYPNSGTMRRFRYWAHTAQRYAKMGKLNDGLYRQTLAESPACLMSAHWMRVELDELRKNRRSKMNTMTPMNNLPTAPLPPKNKSSVPTWIGVRPDGLKYWTFKKNMPVLQSYQKAVRIDFGLHGLCWCIMSAVENTIICALGECPVFSAWLATPGHVIGMKDMQTAGNRPWAEEWRRAFYERSMERAGLGHLVKEDAP